mgnify:CR=1 FL=1
MISINVEDHEQITNQQNENLIKIFSFKNLHINSLLYILKKTINEQI